METCITCNGTGKITRYGSDRHDHYQCASCGGNGLVSPSINRLVRPSILKDQEQELINEKKLETEYFSEWEVIDGLNQHKNGLSYESWLNKRGLTRYNPEGKIYRQRVKQVTKGEESNLTFTIKVGRHEMDEDLADYNIATSMDIQAPNATDAKKEAIKRYKQQFDDGGRYSWSAHILSTPNTREGKTLAEKALKEHSKKTGIEYNSLFSDGFIEGYECQASNNLPYVKSIPSKTLEECKDEVAKAWQYESWEQATKIDSLKLFKFVMKLNDEAAELYRTSNQSNVQSK